MRKPDHPTREEYQSQPTARELRDICLQIAQNTRMIMTEDEGLDSSERSKVYARLEHLQGRLIALGITSDLHVGTFTDQNRRDPVKGAEYVAGQIFDLCGKVVRSQTEAMLAAQEHDAQVEPGLLSVDRIPSQTKDWMSDMTIVNACIRFLDADREFEEWIRNHRKEGDDSEI